MDLGASPSENGIAHRAISFFVFAWALLMRMLAQGRQMRFCGL